MSHRLSLASVVLVLFFGLVTMSGCQEKSTPAPGGGDDAPAVDPGTNETTTTETTTAETTATSKKKPELLVTFGEGCNTPDAMALLPDGRVILSMPNFNNLDDGSFLMQVSPDNKASKFFDLPKNPDTQNPIGPLGVCLAPNGDLFLADYQISEDPARPDRISRVMRITMEDGKPTDIKPVITGFYVSNAVICFGGHLYVSETQIDVAPETETLTSGVYRFKLNELEGDEPVKLVDNPADDPHFLGIIEIKNRELPLGADGLCFDKDGNLYIGNFTDGTVHRMTFKEDGTVATNEVFAKADFMKSADGLFMDPDSGVIYVADSKANAVQLVFPDGKVETLAQSGDTDGLDGGMDQPCETLLRGRELIVSNMDWPVPGCINKEYNEPCTLSVIKLD